MSTPEIRPSGEPEPQPKYWYEPTKAPTGGDWPQAVKEQWVGVKLAVQEEEHIIPPKTLLPEDPDLHITFGRPGYAKIGIQAAISALRLAQRPEAANFWVAVSKIEGWSDDNMLYFRLDEGILTDGETGLHTVFVVDPFPPFEELVQAQ